MNFEKFERFPTTRAKVSVLANRGASHKLFLGGVKCQEYAREKPGIRKQIHNYDHFYAPNPTISVVVYACEVLTSAGWYVLFLVRLILVKCGARRALWPDKTEKKDNWIIKQFEYKHSERVPESPSAEGVPTKLLRFVSQNKLSHTKGARLDLLQSVPKQIRSYMVRSYMGFYR